MQTLHTFQVKIEGISAPVTCKLYADDSTPYWDCCDFGVIIHQMESTQNKPAGYVILQESDRFRYGYCVDIPESIKGMQNGYKEENGNFKKGWRKEVKETIENHIAQCKKYLAGDLSSYIVKLECLGVESECVGGVWLEYGDVGSEYVQELAKELGDSLRENMHARANEIMEAIITIEQKGCYHVG